jgi:hypothetical protein
LEYQGFCSALRGFFFLKKTDPKEKETKNEHTNRPFKKGERQKEILPC